MYVDVLVEIKNKQIDRTFTYLVPLSLQDKIKLGMIVKVPFGSKQVEGYVLKITNEVANIKVKEIIGIKNEDINLNQELLELGKFLQEESLCSLSSAYATMLPKAIKAKNNTNVKKKYVTYLVKNEFLEKKFSKAQIEVLKLFVDKDKILKKDALLVSQSAVKTLLNKKILKEETKEIYRYNFKKVEPDEKKKLTLEQEKAYLKIKSYLGSNKTILLHGVTGSGKTEVYLQIIEQVINNGQTALVLVPEISLTPQFVERFSARFNKGIALLHSGLSDGERYDEWRRINAGDVKIVIGVRSAIFAPLTNIGIIIFDEEHSLSYKQENNPKYHALAIALKRSKTWNCPLVLGSATPSLNTISRALKKVYEYVPIIKRANGGDLPLITLVDMSEEMKHNHLILSRALESEINKCLEKKEQIVLLLNRRGHSLIVTCSNCGYTYTCSNCDITLTYHKNKNQLRCHYCGYTIYKDKVCPKCHEDALNYYGLGTEKLEEYLHKIFPQAKILRMDADTTQNKGKYEEIIDTFYKGNYDILLGTQMVSKGLDFPNVTLVGIINADNALFMPDYKSNENTFSLLMQASGRAGRAKKKGHVIIQSFNITHPVLQCVKENNYFKFFKYEMNLRKILKYPPYYFLVQLKLKGRNYEILTQEIKKIKYYLDEKLDNDVIILGPATSNPFFINNYYQYEILIKYKKIEPLKTILKQLDSLYVVKNNVSLDIDFFY